MGNLHFSIFCKFSMLFNGKFAFCHFPMLFNGNLRIEKLLGGGDVRTDGRMYGRTDGRKEIHPCVLQDIGPLGPLPKKEKGDGRTDGQRDGPTKRSIESHARD